MEEKIRNFTDLTTWQESHKFVLLIYKLTKTFPREEVYCLTSQIRRAAISITSNIAEGFGRRNSGEKIQFYSIAQGSLVECQNQLITARDLEYTTKEQFEKLYKHSIVVNKLLGALISKIKLT